MTFRIVNPTVVMHDVMAKVARTISRNLWVSEISHDLTFSGFLWNLSSVLERTHHIVLRMVAVLEPLICFNF